jgi:hypothetical protein
MSDSESLPASPVSQPQDTFSQLPDPTDESVAAYRALPYGDFLRTSYWITIRDHLVNIVGKCQACSSREALRVHHNTYDNHGREHVHLEDLTVLCERCHSYFHSFERLNNHIPPLSGDASFDNFVVPGVENPIARRTPRSQAIRTRLSQ